ncbi:MAG: hypothetical protein U0525_00440 [Patescibacteria group bacterium]
MRILQKEGLNLTKIALISLLPVLLIYLPFIFHVNSFWGIPFKQTGMQVIFANWDGPNYVYNSITNYSPAQIEVKPFLNVAAYYPAHFPAFSLIIKLFAFVLPIFWSAIFVQLLSGVVLNFLFFYFIRNVSKHALWLTFAFTIFPPRFWIVRAVIGPEMLLVGITLAALVLWDKKSYFLGASLAIIATLFKFQAISIPVAFLAMWIYETFKTKKLNLIPLINIIFAFTGYLIVSYYYLLQTGNFNAYFEAQKLVGMSAALPFSMFNYAQKWVGTGWMESAALYFIAIFAMIAKLLNEKKYLFAIYGIVYAGMLSIIPQVDIMRLSIPLAPLFFYAFHDHLSTKYFRWALIASIPLMYLFAINFILNNQAPIIDWSIFR